MDILDQQLDLIRQTKKEINLSLIDEIVENIYDKRVIILGVGKNENLAIHFASLLQSINVSAVSLSVMNLLHGDIGYIKENDVVIYLTNSGNTSELVQVAPYIKCRCQSTIGIIANKNGKLNKYCDHLILLPKLKEMDRFDKIPTTSILLYIMIINYIVYQITEKTDLDVHQYKLNHPGGNIGNLLNLKVKDIMLPLDKLCTVYKTTSIKECLIKMCKTRLRCAIIIEEQTTNKMLGFVSDGDIRRYISINDINHNIETLINYKPLVAMENDFLPILLERVKEDYRIISGIPIMNDDDKLVGLVSQEELLTYGL